MTRTAGTRGPPSPLPLPSRSSVTISLLPTQKGKIIRYQKNTILKQQRNKEKIIKKNMFALQNQDRHREEGLQLLAVEGQPDR